MELMETSTALDKRDWIAGLDKGLGILEAFNDTMPRMTASQAAQCTGLTRTAARRHLLTLMHLGYVASDGKTFWLTPRVLRLGWGYLDTARLPRTVLPYLQRITGVTDELSYCSVLDDEEVVFIARNGVNRAQSIGFVLGARVPAILTSSGVAIVSARPHATVEAWLQSWEARPYTPRTLTDKGQLLAAIAKAREHGYAVMEEQLEQGVRGIAVPLRNRHSEVIGALSVVMLTAKEPASASVARVVPVLKESAHALLMSL